MTEHEIIGSRAALLADLRQANLDGVPITPENIFAATGLVTTDQAEIFRDGWGYHPCRVTSRIDGTRGHQGRGRRCGQFPGPGGLRGH
jgi:hypothetical protein